MCVHAVMHQAMARIMATVKAEVCSPRGNPAKRAKRAPPPDASSGEAATNAHGGLRDGAWGGEGHDRFRSARGQGAARWYP